MAALNHPVDGFLYNPSIRYWPGQYMAGALAQMDTLRRANTYRPRAYAVPDDFNQPLPAYGTLEYQIKVAGGSYLWGMQFRQYSAAYAEQAPTSIVIQVTEACTGIPVCQEFYWPRGISEYSTAGLEGGIPMPFVLPQPRLFTAPGDINLELSNLSGSAQYCQLTLYFAEPCEMVEVGHVGREGA
jgi:hypothetical protein